MNRNPFLICVGRNLESEARQKHWHKDMAVNLAISKMLFKKTLKTLHSSSLPYTFISESNQRNASLGNKMSDILSAYFKSHDSLILIGTDTFDLTKDNLHYASNTVAEDTAVVGKSADGGAYLIGFHKSHFDPEGFAKLKWGKSDFFNSLIAYLGQKNIYTDINLEEYTDIDGKEDLESLITSNSEFKRMYYHFAIKEKFIIKRKISGFNHLLTFQSFNRGPPPFAA